MTPATFSTSEQYLREYEIVAAIKTGITCLKGAQDGLLRARFAKKDDGTPLLLDVFAMMADSTRISVTGWLNDGGGCKLAAWSKLTTLISQCLVRRL